MAAPKRPKIYHIVHVDRLASIVMDDRLLSDARLAAHPRPGSIIGMSRIKERRLNQLTLSSHPGLFVGQCVPFYFCPRSIMLYLIHCANHDDLAYRGGQEPIVHLEADLQEAVAWADKQSRRWAFTLSNAGSFYFEDRKDLNDLGDINWDAVGANRWAGNGIPGEVKEGKQAEFLVERSFPWYLIERIGVQSKTIAARVASAISGAAHKPGTVIRPDWYY